MPPEPQSKGHTLKVIFHLAMRAALYVSLFVLRFLARLLLIVATATPAAIPFIVVFVILLYWPAGLVDWIVLQLGSEQILTNVVGYLIALGLFSGVLQYVVKTSCEAVKEIFTTCSKALPTGWIPIESIFDREQRLGKRVIESLTATWRDNIAEIPGNMGLTAWRAMTATTTFVAGTLLVAIAIPLLVPKPGLEDRYVWVVDAERDTQREIKKHLRVDTVFSLVHLKNAQPQSGDGIGLDESQKDWLHAFRDAVAECVATQPAERNQKAPLLEVRAFASVAPVKSEGVSSEKLNCEIANRRADAVGAYLAYGGVGGQEAKHRRKWEHDSVKEDFLKEQQHCAAGTPTGPESDYSHVLTGAKDPIFKVRVHRWQDPSTMRGGKPADDGSVPDRRRFDVELFNRSVHISIPRGFCRRGKLEESEGEPAATGTRDAQPPEEPTNAL